MVVTESCLKMRWNRFCLLMGYGKVPAGRMDPQTLSWPFLENTVCHGHYQCYREGRWIGSREGNILLSAWVSSKCQNSERELGKWWKGREVQMLMGSIGKASSSQRSLPKKQWLWPRLSPLAWLRPFLWPQVASTGQSGVSWVTSCSPAWGRATPSGFRPALLASWLNPKPPFPRDLEFH